MNAQVIGLNMALAAIYESLNTPPKSAGPQTLAQLSYALQNLPQPKAPEPYTDALEAFAAWKPLTLDMVREKMAHDQAARAEIMADYTRRTGQQVEYCDDCRMGVAEVEEDDGFGTVVHEVACEMCEGLGIVEVAQ